MSNQILFTVIENNIHHPIQTYHGEYKNLMYLLKDKFLLDEFCECGGIGRCGTCIIRAEEIKGNSQIKDRKEPTTLSKIGILKGHYRLSCQIFITKDLNDSILEILS